MKTELRLAACVTHPIQYQTPVWRRLAAMPGVSFHAYFGTDMSVRGYRDREFGRQVAWDTPLVEGYPHTFLSTDPRIQQISFWKPAATGLVKAFRSFQPDVVLLAAYGGRFHLGALRAAKNAGAKVVMRHEASDVAVSRSRLKGLMRDGFLRRLYGRIDGFAVIGTEARSHLVRLGVPAPKLTPAPYCVDTDFFAGQVEQWSPQRARIRDGLGIGANDIVLMFAGKLIPKKDPLLIAAALRLLKPAQRKHLHLLVAGDGELRAELERAMHEVLGDRVRFFGFLNQTEIGRAYAASDLLVLPSRSGAGETWGLVVNEAMQFGLGLVLSDGVGCGPDLVTRATGRIFPSGNAAAAAAAIEDCIEARIADPRHFAAAAQQRVEDFTTARAAAGVVQMARTVAGHEAA